jgi:hypothetical protein
MIIIKCPHCKIWIEIIEINCAIFRCGLFKHNFQQIPQHENKKMCDLYIKNDLIYGCSKPFKIVDSKPVICDYI